MAERLELVVINRTTLADYSSIDFLSDGWTPDGDGWVQQIASPGESRVQEPLSLHAMAASDNDLALMVRALDSKIEQVTKQTVSMDKYELWLRAQMTGESNPRQALVTSVKRGGAKVRSMFARQQSTLGGYELGLERMPYWEPDVYTRYNFKTAGISCIGGTFDFTTEMDEASAVIGPVLGDVNARIRWLYLENSATGSSADLSEVWMGFRTDRFGDRTKFVGAWDCALGTLSEDTITASDATARSGTAAVCQFDVSTLLPRATISAGQVSASYYADQRGRFIVLMRAKCDAATTGRARIAAGIEAELGSSANWIESQLVTVSGTGYKLYKMGIVDLPIGDSGIVADVKDMKFSGVRVEAERTSGTGYLHMDCLIMIPIAEGYVYLDKARINYENAGYGQVAMIIERANGRVMAESYINHTGFREFLPIQVADAHIEKGVPVGGCIAVFAAQHTDGSFIADEIGFEMQVFPRYVTLSGEVIAP